MQNRRALAREVTSLEAGLVPLEGFAVLALLLHFSQLVRLYVARELRIGIIRSEMLRKE